MFVIIQAIPHSKQNNTNPANMNNANIIAIYKVTSKKNIMFSFHLFKNGVSLSLSSGLQVQIKEYMRIKRI
jgi:hypothetical protein